MDEEVEVNWELLPGGVELEAPDDMNEPTQVYIDREDILRMAQDLIRESNKEKPFNLLDELD